MKDALLLLIPLWSANVLINIFAFFRKKYHLPDFSLDGGRLWSDGRPIFGSSKTFLGLPIKLLGGYLGGVIISSPNGLLSGGAVFLGAVASGFLKRRLGLARGKPLPLVDQSDYLFAAYLLFFLFEKTIPFSTFIIALCITIPIHLITNMIAFRLKIRETRW